MNQHLRVVYWNNQPTPYVVDRFNAVVERGIELHAWFDNMRENDRSWDVDPSKWSFRSEVLGTHDGDRLISRIPMKLIKSTRPDVLICNYDRAHMVVGAIAAAPFCERVALRALPSFTSWVGNRPHQALAKHVVFRSVDAAKVPGPAGAEYAKHYGMPASRIWRVKQSIMKADYAAALELTPEERRERRATLGLDERCTFVYVGRIWKGKGLDTLIDAYVRVTAATPAQLLIVGDGQDEAYFRERTRDVPGIVWAGFVQPVGLPMLYAVSDVLVFPTLGDPNGLVVEEAMASGIPVISSDAAGDIRLRVRQGEVGYVVPANDSRALADKMVDMANDPTGRARMGSQARAVAAGFTPSRYAEDFQAFVEGVLARPRRRALVPQAARLIARLT